MRTCSSLHLKLEPLSTKALQTCKNSPWNKLADSRGEGGRLCPPPEPAFPQLSCNLGTGTPQPGLAEPSERVRVREMPPPRLLLPPRPSPARPACEEASSRALPRAALSPVPWDRGSRKAKAALVAAERAEKDSVTRHRSTN